jgi:hypothetical protein
MLIHSLRLHSIGAKTNVDNRRMSNDARLARACSQTAETGLLPSYLAALRTAVQWRKIMFGTRSDHGERAVERLVTIVRTCAKRRGSDVRGVRSAATDVNRRGRSVEMRTFAAWLFPFMAWHAFAPGTAVAQSEDRFGAFTVSRSTDPITDADRSIVGTPATAVSGGSRRSPILGWRCMSDGLNVVYMFDRYLIDASVLYRFDSDQPSQLDVWDMLTSHQGAAIPIRMVAEFTTQAMVAQRVVLRVTDRDGEQLTDTFSLNGLTKALPQLPCYGPGGAKLQAREIRPGPPPALALQIERVDSEWRIRNQSFGYAWEECSIDVDSSTAKLPVLEPNGTVAVLTTMFVPPLSADTRSRAWVTCAVNGSRWTVVHP